jgi:hypothetical protein
VKGGSGENVQIEKRREKASWSGGPILLVSVVLLPVVVWLVTLVLWRLGSAKK